MKQYPGEMEWVQTVAVLLSLGWIGMIVYRLIRAMMIAL